jgi:hypothetical protein
VSIDRQLAWQHAGNGHGVYGALFAAMFLTFAQASWLLIAGGAVAGFAVGKLIGLALLGLSGRAAQTVYAPPAAGRYAHTHSNIDTLEARGDFKGAAAAWDAVAVSEPANAWPLLRAGELYARLLGEPRLALERFLRARDVPRVSAEHDRYASLKIVDLYLGPLNDTGRGLVELRRLVEHHPGTREAEYARSAIVRLKEERPPA